MTKDETLVRQLKQDYRPADLSAADRAMLEYCDKLTRSPSEVNNADVEALRHTGFSDSAVLDICQVAAYFNFVNRLADGLGVELEGYWGEKT